MLGIIPINELLQNIQAGSNKNVLRGKREKGFIIKLRMSKNSG